MLLGTSKPGKEGCAERSLDFILPPVMEGRGFVHPEFKSIQKASCSCVSRFFPFVPLSILHPRSLFHLYVVITTLDGPTLFFVFTIFPSKDARCEEAAAADPPSVCFLQTEKMEDLYISSYDSADPPWYRVKSKRSEKTFVSRGGTYHLLLG